MKKEIIYDVKGMTCAVCAASVEKLANKALGVIEANVNLATEQLRVVTDESFDEKRLFKSVVLSGYKIAKKDLGLSLADKQKRKLKQMQSKIIIALIFLLPLLYISMGYMIPVLTLSIFSPDDNPVVFAVSQLILTVPIMVLGYKYYVNGFKNIFKGHPNMDSLVAIGTISSFLYGIYGLLMIINGHHLYAFKLYFESSAVILVLIMVGKYMEQKSTTKTTSELEKLMDLKPKTAIIFENQTYSEVPLENVLVNQIVLVKPGDLIPVDGIITSGTTAINEAMMTGEPLPKDKNIGDKVIGGTVNITGAILIKATHVGEDTVLSNIIKKVSEAQIKKAPIQRLADVISKYFVPVVFLLAVISFLFWLIYLKDFNFAINIFVSVLVIACPCSLGLATPTAIMTASGKAASLKILIASGDALEISSKTSLVVFDKTGTITEGRPVVEDIINIGNISIEKLLVIAASLETQSNHPIALALTLAAKEKGFKLLALKSFENFPGLGIKGIIEDKTYYLGNEKLMKKVNISLGQTTKVVQDFGQIGKTTIYISSNEKLLGLISVADKIKTGAKATINLLKEKGIKTYLLSGDNHQTVKYVANQLGIDQAQGSLLPADKQEVIKTLKKEHVVMMVGDGINDAIALSEANIGVGLASGTDIAMSAGDVVLMRSDLKDILTLIDLSKKTIINIKQNLFWAFFYNIVGIPIAMGVLTFFGGPLLNPMIAALAMSFSSVSVVLNALRLKRYKEKR